MEGYLISISVYNMLTVATQALPGLQVLISVEMVEQGIRVT